MPNPTHAFWRAVRGIRLRIFKRRQSGPFPGVVLHDPQADKPKDLDDPFQDADTQKRIGELIARITTRSKTN